VPENSVGLRISVLASILIAEISILAMGYYDAATVIGVPALTVAGFAFSWRYRSQRNLLLKFILSLLVIATAVFFVRELAVSLNDTRLPLIKLLLWMQVLHSFDVPARRDLKFSLVSGLILIAAGAVLSTGMLYIIGLALFSIAAIVALIYFHISEASQKADLSLEIRPVQLLAYASLAWLAGIVVAVPLLLIMPQSTQARLHTLPLSNLQRIFGDFSSEVVNPFYSDGSNPFDSPPQFNPNSYYGFNPYMDLRARGNLSDEIVLKVRSDSYGYYRGLVFDRYNGKGWEMGSADTTEIMTDEAPFTLTLPDSRVLAFKTQVQSFFVQTDLPNIIFAAWKPEQLFFPANRIKVDGSGSLRSPFPLTEGTIYSVITDQPVYDAATLRRFPRETDARAAPNYTELPDDDATLEVRRLAGEITNPYNNRYDQMQAIEQYLKDNYAYDLTVPPQTEETDAVAYFLFQEKRGYCEHFASAMAVLARSAGVPARVVTGYSGGTYNPFTALWEIKQSDAHAWVEVYFGRAGWVPFDPTPGFDVPDAQGSSQSPWLAGKIFSYLGDALGNGPVGGALASIGASARGAIGLTMALPLALVLGLALGLAVLVWGSRKALERMLRERRRRALVLRGLEAAYSREEILKEYLELSVRLQQHGLSRRPDETLRQFSRRVARLLDTRDFTELSEIIERLRYGEEKLPEPSKRRAGDLTREVARKLNTA